jgi:hypothetical protein
MRPVWPVIPRGPIQLEEPTLPPHADRELPRDRMHQCAFARGLQAFFASTFYKITLSKVRSATSWLSFRLSSSSCRSRRISATSMGPYFFRQ